MIDEKPAMMTSAGLRAGLQRLVRSRRRSRALALIPPVLVVVLIGVILIQAWHAPAPDSIGSDASQNLRSALNFMQAGVYGESADAAIPGYRREPFPNWLLAGHLRWFVRPPAGIRFHQLVADPDLLRRTTRLNLFYLLGLLLSLWGLCLCLIRPVLLAHLLALPVIVCSVHFFAASELSNLNTELPAAWLLILLSLALVLLRRRSRWGWAILAGAIYGCLALTKASGAYLALLILPILPMLLNHSRRQALHLTLCVGLGFALTVLPWVGRNFLEFGNPSIAPGGGKVLMFRASYNTMTPDEYRGSFYAFAPRRLQHDVLGPLMGYSRSALECGGSLQRLSRDLSCDQKAIAEKRFADVKGFYQRVQHYQLDVLKREAIDQGFAGSADAYVRRVALARITANPGSHLAVSLPLSWQGFWSFDGRKTWLAVIINGLAMSSLLAMPLLGVLLRQPEWTLVSVVGVGYFLFYGLLSHFIARYSQPMIPLSLLCLAVLAVAAGRSVIDAWVGLRSRPMA